MSAPTKNNLKDFKPENGFRKELTGYVVPKTHLDTVLERYLPLTNYLVNGSFKEDASDSKSLSFAKTVARAITYFFTIVTAAPIYQKLLCLSSKKFSVVGKNAERAKEALDVLSAFHGKFDKLLSEAHRGCDMLNPEALESLEDAVNNNKVTVTVSDEQKGTVLANLQDLRNNEKKAYDEVVEAQVKNISEYLSSLKPSERFKAHRDVISAFINLPGYDTLSEKQRTDFAIRMSNQTGIALIKNEVAQMLKDVRENHNFINLNKKIDGLAKNVASVFQLTEDRALAFVAVFLKRETENYSKFIDNQKSLLENVTDKDLQKDLENSEKDYLGIMENLIEACNVTANNAVITDATAILAIDKELKSLKKKAGSLTKEAKSVEHKLALVKAGKKLDGIIPILKSESELTKELKAVRDSRDAVVSKIDETLNKVKAIDAISGVKFDGKNFDELRDAAKKALEAERELKDKEGNLVDRNKRSFDAFRKFFDGVKETESPEASMSEIKAKLPTLQENDKYTTLGRKIRNLAAFSWLVGDKKPVLQSIGDVLAAHDNISSPVKTAVKDFSDRNKKIFNDEVKGQTPKKPSGYSPLVKGTLAAAGVAVAVATPLVMGVNSFASGEAVKTAAAAVKSVAGA